MPTATIKLYAYAIVTLLLLAAIGGFAWKWHHMQTEITTLTSNNQQLTQSVKEQTATIAAITKEKEAVTKLLDERDARIAKSTQQLSSLKRQIKSMENKDAQDWLHTTIPSSIIDSVRNGTVESGQPGSKNNTTK